MVISVDLFVPSSTLTRWQGWEGDGIQQMHREGATCLCWFGADPICCLSLVSVKEQGKSHCASSAGGEGDGVQEGNPEPKA